MNTVRHVITSTATDIGRQARCACGWTHEAVDQSILNAAIYFHKVQVARERREAKSTS